MFVMSIPRLNGEEIMRRYSHVKPVVTVNGKMYHLREYTLREIRETSYYFDQMRDLRAPVNDNELEIWKGHEFACLHSYGYPGIFKPSVEEVLSQISKYDIAKAKAFEILEIPQESTDFYRSAFHKEAFNNGYHVSMVRLYISKM